MTDQLGSPRVLVSSLGEVVSRRDFMPFGEEIFPDGTHRTTNLKYTYGDNVRQKFTGYQKDEETQLDFAEARMYENRHARFTAVDPLLASGKSANPQTFNRYVYVMNSPLAFTDPSGLQAGGTIEEDPVIVRINTWISRETGAILEWVSRTISWNGQTTRVWDSVPAYQMIEDPESFEYKRRKLGNVVLKGASPLSPTPSDGYMPFGTPEQVRNVEGAINTVDQTGLFNLMNTAYKHDTGQASSGELAGASLSFGTTFVPAGKNSKLAANMLESGLARPFSSAAHHIVALADKRASEARAILDRAGVDINDAANGVFLPANTRISSMFGGSSSLHHPYKRLLRSYNETTE